ncbi:MAG: hypothetical protein KGN35_12960 [Betaproteobacteria bacterium]|nr:hypothetical protein [Betaproteobacteria bacterium]
MDEMLTLNVIVPAAITDSMFTSSTAPETDYLAWNSGTTYAAGDRVIVVATHKIYESAQGGNLNKAPFDVVNRVGTPPWWFEVGPTNKWAMFDGLIGTKTTIATPLTVVLRPGFINAIYLAGLSAENINVSIKDAPGGTVVYSYSASLENSLPPDYFEHFFMPFSQQSDIALRNIPPYYNAEVTITLSSVSGNVSCGLLTMGDMRPIGMTEWGGEAQPKTYSRLSEDIFGSPKIIQRPSGKNMRLTAEVALVDADFVEETVRKLQDVPAAWIGVDLMNFAGLRVFGLGSGSLIYQNAKFCQLNLIVKGFAQ